MNYPEHIETERLLMRPASTKDAAFFLKLLNSPKWLKYIGDRNVHTEADAEDYIKERMLPQLKQLGFTNNIVIRKSDKAIVGCCGLFDREGIEGLDIGFAFLPEYEKNGYAYESAKKLIDMAFSTHQQTKVNAITISVNHDSRKLLEKLGLIFKEYIRIPNDEEELMLYEIRT